jgi:hypothetical protein
MAYVTHRFVIHTKHDTAPWIGFLDTEVVLLAQYLNHHDSVARISFVIWLYNVKTWKLECILHV